VYKTHKVVYFVKVNIKSKSSEETEALGEKIGRLLKKGDIILLTGDLGAGKTVFAKGIGRGMGINDYITSPTFMLVNEHTGKIPLYHFDVYRIADYSELYDIGYEEYFYGDGVCVIEWSEKIEPLLPKDNLHVFLKMGDAECERNIEIISNGERYNDILKEMNR
jgi:tRNA threonylcarbamoyladenosine biosynthesis protein TsaE